jgi:DNA-binding transcriptional LysR family regulator
MHFDLTDLRIFVATAEAGNLTHAARRQHIAVGAASARIRALEAAVGARLFDRQAKGVRLTPAGEAMLHHARRMLEQTERMRAELAEHGRGLRGRIRLSAVMTAVAEFLPERLASFLATRPQANVDVEERLSHDVVRAVVEHAADIGIASSGVATQGLQVFPFRSIRLVLAAGVDHPLAGRASIRLEDALGHDFVALTDAASLGGFVNERFGTLGRTPNVRAQVRSFDDLCRLAAAGVGLAVVPDVVMRRFARSRTLVAIPLDDAWALREMRLCVRDLPSLPAMAQELVAHLQPAARAGNVRR